MPPRVKKLEVIRLHPLPRWKMIQRCGGSTSCLTASEPHCERNGSKKTTGLYLHCSSSTFLRNFFLPFPRDRFTFGQSALRSRQDKELSHHPRQKRKHELLPSVPGLAGAVNLSARLLSSWFTGRHFDFLGRREVNRTQCKENQRSDARFKTVHKNAGAVTRARVDAVLKCLRAPVTCHRAAGGPRSRPTQSMLRLAQSAMLLMTKIDPPPSRQANP